jgi:hypothetical protein
MGTDTNSALIPAMPDRRILVRSSLAQWPSYLIGSIGVVLVAGGIVLATMAQLEPIGILLGIAGIAFIIGAFIFESRRVKQLMWIALEDHRFTVTDNIGERTFNDDDIVSMALKYKENFDNGVMKSMTRTFRIWIVSHAEQPELIEMTGKLALGSIDPLQGFIDRIVSLLKERAYAERAQGHSVLGEKWILEGKKLILRDPNRGEIELTLNEVAAADYIDTSLKLWRRGEEASFAEIPRDSANCHLLKVLLEDELAGRTQPSDQDVSAGQLGRIIFERKQSRTLAIFMLVFAGIFFLTSLIPVVVLLTQARPKEPGGLIIMAAVFLFLSILFALIARYCFRNLFRCHAQGIFYRGLFGESSLLFTEMQAFTFSARRQHNHGVYTGTMLKLAFDPKPEFRHKRIVYRTTVRNVDGSIAALRDQIARKLADDLIEAVRNGQSVEWTPKLTLTPDSLRYIPTGIFTKKPPELLPYDQISGHTMDHGTFAVYAFGQTKPIVSESTAARNFFPGFLAFQALLSEAQRQPHSAKLEAASK